MTESEVLIVGAGPTGLTLAIDLGKRGVRCTLIEQKEKPAFLPKMERINARSMEIYRRLGLSQKIRAAGLRPDCPMDVYVMLALNVPPLLHLTYPSVEEAQKNVRATNDGTMPLEPYQLISQYTLEPLLKSIAETIPAIDVRFGCELISFAQDAAGVNADVKYADGRTAKIRTRYMVGCDGGNSTVRKQLGIELEGRGRISQQRQIFFRSETLFSQLPFGPGRHYHFPSGMIVVQDDLRHFMANTGSVSGPTPDVLLQEIFRITVPFEVLNVALWHQNLLVAERYSDRRVFLAGDAVHLVIPTGGLGMNTGVGDAIDLSWKLAGTLAGWAGPQLLASYELERRPIGLRIVKASRAAMSGRLNWRAAYHSDIRKDTPEGSAIRAEMARRFDVEQRKVTEILGIEAGYRYVGSPIVWPEPGDGPDPDNPQYVPTTW